VTPPLRGQAAFLETRLPFKRVKSVQRVLVGIDGAGTPVSVNVVQRLTLNGLGDYTFAVPGPVTDVVAAPGSASEPGLRRGAILWAGFSSGRKLLASRATLRLRAAAPELPLRLTITRKGGALTIRGENTTQLPADLLVGPSAAAQTAAALDSTRATARRGPALQDIYVEVPRLPHAKHEQVRAPLRVTGEVRLPGGRRVPIDYLLGDGGPQRFVLRIPGVTDDPTVHIVVRPVSPVKLVTPPGGAKSWVDAVRTNRVAPLRLLELASRARLTIARAVDYGSFLVNPDPRGISQAEYVYETGARTAPPAALPAATGSGGDGWTTALVAALLVLGAGGLVVLWAHH
jgi:hypothetical protein